MKRILTIAMTLMLALYVQAQGSVTSFLGIPVDGSRATMVKELVKKGFVRKSNDRLDCVIEGVPYIVKIMTNKGRVCRISLIEKEGTEDVSLAVEKYNALIEWYRNSKDYTEYEYNDPIRSSDNLTYERYICEGWYYAEFFQVCDPQLYSKRVSFKLSDEYGDYRIVRCYDNIYNLPEGEE